MTSEMIDGIKVERMDDSFNKVPGEWSTFNVSDIRQSGSTYYMDHIKEERKSPNIDDIDQSNPCDDVDISEEGVRRNMENFGENYIYDNSDIKVEVDCHDMESTCVSIDIKEEDTDVYIDDIKAKRISNNHDGLEQQEHDEAKETRNKGNVSGI